MRISSTQLESYRRYVAFDYVSDKDMVDTVLRRTEENDAMRLGSDLEYAIMGGDCSRFDQSDIDMLREEFSGSLDTAQTKLVKEVAGHDLVGMTDFWHGNVTRDMKVSEKPFDAGKIDGYIDSAQWRSYLHIFEVDWFVYDVFRVKYVKGNDDIPPHWKVMEHNQLSMGRYPELESDVRRAVIEYAAFAQPIIDKHERETEAAQ